MSYLRSIRVDELRKWLLEKGYAEAEAGYGHVTADELAQALVDKFDILVVSTTQQ